MSERETDAAPPEVAEKEPRRGLLRKARDSAGFLGRTYVRMQFGDMKGFVEEQKRFGSWLMRYLRRRTDGRRESFNDAMHRLGLGEADLAARCVSLERISWMYGAVASVAFVFLVCAPLVKHSVSQFLLSLGLFLLMGTRCGATRFRIAQIRNRCFMGVLDWIKGEGSSGRIGS